MTPQPATPTTDRTSSIGLLHLDDAPLASGCLQVVPGCHKDGPLEHVTGDHTREQHLKPPARA